MTETKPLNWTPKPGVGFTVVRRDDGGMTLTFTDLSDATINEWREFAMEHLLGVDRRTRNLYDIRAVKEIPEKAIRMAVEANSDPSARNIRVAVVVADESVAKAIRRCRRAGAVPGTASAMKIFTRYERSRSLARASAGSDTVNHPCRCERSASAVSEAISRSAEIASA